MDAKLFENLSKSIKKFDGLDISGYALNNPPPELLLLDQDNFETHVLMQAPAISYYGYQLNRAEATVKSLRDGYDKWLKIKKLEAGAQIMGSDPDGYKPSEAAKEARVFVNSKQESRVSGVDEDESWREKIRLAEEYRDTIKFWFDGFNAKNFHIKIFGDIMLKDGRQVNSIRKTDNTPVEEPLSSFGNKRKFVAVD
jgi:hypothetical protein